jgi:chromosome segregation ATPase
LFIPAVGKAKIVLENKTRVEMEVITVRGELTRLEADLQKSIEQSKSLETHLLSAKEQLSSSLSTVEQLTESCSKYKGLNSELDETVQRKNKAIESLKEDLVKLERDSLIEIRRLRLQVTSAEQEINELRPMIPLLQKEASDTKANALKLQANNSGTVNGLLEEVRKAEDNLNKERKKLQSEVGDDDDDDYVMMMMM